VDFTHPTAEFPSINYFTSFRTGVVLHPLAQESLATLHTLHAQRQASAMPEGPSGLRFAPRPLPSPFAALANNISFAGVGLSASTINGDVRRAISELRTLQPEQQQVIASLQKVQQVEVGEVIGGTQSDFEQMGLDRLVRHASQYLSILHLMCTSVESLIKKMKTLHTDMSRIDRSGTGIRELLKAAAASGSTDILSEDLDVPAWRELELLYVNFVSDCLTCRSIFPV
jgi:hypothetical protein